jgi:hypothetical protein
VDPVINPSDVDLAGTALEVGSFAPDAGRNETCHREGRSGPDRGFRFEDSFLCEVWSGEVRYAEGVLRNAT